MTKIIKMVFVLILLFSVVGCEMGIATRTIEEEIDNPDKPIVNPIDSGDPIVNPEIISEPTEAEIKMWTDFLTDNIYREFYYNIALNYLDNTVEHPIDYREDIEYNSKIHFGAVYMNDYPWGTDCNKAQ